MLIFVSWSLSPSPTTDFRALFLQGLFAAVFLVRISYSEIALWGLLRRLGPLQCREYSRLMWWDCHGDRLPGVRSCLVLGIYSPQTSLWAGQCSYQGRFWKSFPQSFQGQGCLGERSLVPLWQELCFFCFGSCCFVLLCLNGCCKK